MNTPRRRPDGRAVGRARGLARLGRELRRRARGAGLPGHQRIDVGRDLAARLAEARPDVAFNALHGRYRRGRPGAGPARPDGHSLHPLGRARLGPGHGQADGHAALPQRRPASAPRASRSSSRICRTGRRRWTPPFVVKPAAEGSSVDVVDRHDGRHQCAGRPRTDIAPEAPVPGRALHAGPRADLRRARRGGADRDRDPPEEEGASTTTAPSTPKAVAEHIVPAPLPRPVFDKVCDWALARALGARLPRRQPRRFPLRPDEGHGRPRSCSRSTPSPA